MKKEDFKPGQTVYLLPIRFMPYEFRVIEKRIIETKVVAVGRKYITVEYGKLRFEIENDFRESTDYVVQFRLFHSKQDIQNAFKRNKMEERVQTAFHFPNLAVRKMTFDELQTIFDIVSKYMKY